MKLIKVAAAVLNQTPLDWQGNTANILSAIDAAKSDGVSLLCLPELCITGYGCEDAFFSAGLRRTARDVLSEIVLATDGIAVSVGLPVMYESALYNTACLIADGKIIGFVAKQNLAGDGLHYEPRWFKPWPNDVRETIAVDGDDYPIGDIYFELGRSGGGVRLGFEICEDAWVAARPGHELAGEAVDIIFNPSASHFAFDKIRVRERFVLEGSRAFGVTYVYSNLLGNEAGRAIYDGGAMIATAGEMVTRGPRFSFQDVVLTSVVVDIDATRMARARLSSFRPAVDEMSACVKVDFTPAETALQTTHDVPDEFTKEEEFTRAIALALFDYMRKSRSNGFIVSLSGGADSTAVACLIALMTTMACKELGRDGLSARLRHIDFDDADPVSQLLTTVYQATENSSDATRSAASKVAAAIGAAHMEFEVGDLVDGYVTMVEKAIGRELDWGTDDIALQNIQARVRAPGVWMLANLKNALLVSTSNRSEAAVGYATMDGDTCGGISPIAGIDKAFLRHWLCWLETVGPEGVGPIPQLHVVNALTPSAELRPLDDKQTDEDDLMPYDLLDAIEHEAIGEKKTPIEVFETVCVAFEQYADKQLGLWVERFFNLWCRNQWKRERYAPSFHVDDKNLDPKTWCRFPILSGGFERELAELRSRINA